MCKNREGILTKNVSKAKIENRKLKFDLLFSNGQGNQLKVSQNSLLSLHKRKKRKIKELPLVKMKRNFLASKRFLVPPCDEIISKMGIIESSK